MTIVHVAAIPQEKEQRCVRCCRKIHDIDPIMEVSYKPLAFVAVSETGEKSIQDSDAGEGQAACQPKGRKDWSKKR